MKRLNSFVHYIFKVSITLNSELVGALPEIMEVDNFSDLDPIPQYDGQNPVVSISYSDECNIIFSCSIYSLNGFYYV